jgi:putative ABC transport system permease protein
VLLASIVTALIAGFAGQFNGQLIGLSVTPIVALICLGVALLIGIVSSFIPAFNAARTNILDSLRYAG